MWREMILPNVRGHITRAEMSSYLYRKCTITKTKVYYSSFLLLMENDKHPPSSFSNTSAKWARFEGSRNGEASECRITTSAKRLNVPKGHGKSNVVVICFVVLGIEEVFASVTLYRRRGKRVARVRKRPWLYNSSLHYNSQNPLCRQSTTSV